MQNYYGMAIRHNPGQLHEMKKGIGAVLWHCSDIQNLELRHQFCPKSNHSWCKYQSDKITGMSTYKPSTSLPVAIKREIQMVFQDLSSNELLSLCLEGTIQNPNETFNQFVWQRYPKQTFLSKQVLESGVYSSVLTYNDGFISLKNAFVKPDITVSNTHIPIWKCPLTSIKVMISIYITMEKISLRSEDFTYV